MNILKLDQNKIALITLTVVMLVFALGALYYGSTFTGEKMRVIHNVFYKSYLAINILLIYSFISLVKSTMDPNKVILVSRANIWFALFCSFALISYFWSDDKALFTYKFMLIFSGVMAYFLARDIKLNENNLQLLSILFTLPVLIISVIGIFQWLIDYQGGPGAILSANAGTPVTFGNKNLATHVVVILFPVMFYSLVRPKNLVYFALSVFSIISALIFLYLSGTKGSWVAVLFEFVFLFILFVFAKDQFRKKISYKEILIVVSILFFYFVVFTFLNERSFFVAAGDAQKQVENFTSGELGSLANRLYIWSDSLSYIVRSPFYGHGLGNFHNELSYDGLLHILQRAHNDLLELTVELGIIGLFLFLAYLIFLLFDQIKIISSKTDYLFYSLSFIGVLGIFSHSMVSFPFQVGIIPIIFGILVSIHTKKASEFSKPVNYQPSKFFKYLIFITLSLVFFFVAVQNSKYLELPSLFLSNAGIKYSKYNKNTLKNMPNYPFQDSDFYKAYMAYWNEGYKARGYEIMDIALEKNPKNMYALRKQFELFLKEKDFKNAKVILDKMDKVSEFHAFSFLSSMEYYKYTNNKKRAMAIFDRTLDYYNNNWNYDKALTKYLLFWSVTLGKYQHTEFLYNNLRDNFYAISDEVDSLTVMANFYAYTGNISKGYLYYKKAQEMMSQKIESRIDTSLINKNVEEVYKKYESQIKQ